MKRYLSILLAAVTIFTIGCRKDNTKDNENRDTKASPTMTVAATATPTPTEKPSETPVQSSDEAADATKSPEPQGGEDLTQTATAEATEPTATPSATQAVVTSNPTLVPSVNHTVTVAPTVKSTVKPTVKPTQTVAPTVKPTAKPTATVKPTQKPTPTPTAKPTLIPYDDAKAQYWVDFAEDYAASIGLRVTDAEEYAKNILDLFNIELGEEMVWYDGNGNVSRIEVFDTWKDVVRENSSWDTPIVVCAKMNQSYIPEDLISRLERYKRVGIKGVCIWYEKYDSEYAPTADAYQIYIAYSGLNEN